MIKRTDLMTYSSQLWERLSGQEGKRRALDQQVWQVARHSFGLLSLTRSANFAVMWAFNAVPLSLALTQAALLLVSLRLAWAVGHYFFSRWNDPKAALESRREHFSEMQEIGRNIAHFNLVNLIGLSGFNISIHEVGHALMARACFLQASPSIVISPFAGGATQIENWGNLTAFGQWIGGTRAELLVTLGGMGASVLFAMVEFALAHRWEKKNPEWSRMLSLHGMSLVANEICYGVGTLLTDDRSMSNDFFRAWTIAGIHPALIVFLLVALPLAEKALLNKQAS